LHGRIKRLSRWINLAGESSDAYFFTGRFVAFLNGIAAATGSGFLLESRYAIQAGLEQVRSSDVFIS